MGAYHSSYHPKTATFRAIFIAPTQLKRFGFLPFIERHSLSQPFGLPAPSLREPGWVRTIHRTTQKPQHFGRFSSPLRNSKDLDFYHSSKYTPSASHSLSSSLREGAGNEPHHATHHPKTARFRAIFIAPTQLKRFGFLPFIERHSLSFAFAQQLPQRGSRDWAAPFIAPPKNRNISGDFHRPYESSKNFTFHRITSQKRN